MLCHLYDGVGVYIRVTTVSIVSSPSLDRSTDRIENVTQPIRKQTRAAGFWGAITLPFLYAPLLAMGVDTLTEATVLFALMVVNLFALVVGRRHRTD